MNTLEAYIALYTQKVTELQRCCGRMVLLHRWHARIWTRLAPILDDPTRHAQQRGNIEFQHLQMMLPQFDSVLSLEALRVQVLIEQINLPWRFLRHSRDFARLYQWGDILVPASITWGGVLVFACDIPLQAIEPKAPALPDPADPLGGVRRHYVAQAPITPPVLKGQPGHLPGSEIVASSAYKFHYFMIKSKHLKETTNDRYHPNPAPADPGGI